MISRLIEGQVEQIVLAKEVVGVAGAHCFFVKARQASAEEVLPSNWLMCFANCPGRRNRDRGNAVPDEEYNQYIAAALLVSNVDS